MNEFIKKAVAINNHNFNLFVYLIFILLIIDTLTNNFLSSLGINKIALLTFIGVSATIKVYFKIKDKIIVDNITIKNTSPKKMITTASKISKKIFSGKKTDLLIPLAIIGAIFLYQKPTQQVIASLSQAGIANYVIYGILITLYILATYITFYEKNPRENSKSTR